MSKIRLIVLTTALIAVAGCASDQPSDRAAVEIKGSNPGVAAAPQTAPRLPALDAEPSKAGIVSYDGYQAAVARSGDTVSSVADRIGLSASELGAYNGLSPSHPLRAGDELVLPPRPGGYSGGSDAVVAATPGLAYPTNPDYSPSAAPGRIAAPIEAAPLDGSGSPVAPAPSAGAGWSADLAAAAIERSTGIDAQGNLAEPPSAAEPLPPEPQKPVELASPQLRQYQTPAATPGLTAVTPAPAAPAPAAPATASPAPSTVPAPRPVETITTPQEQVVEETPEVKKPEPEKLAALTPATSSELRLIRPVTGPVVIHFGQSAGRTRSDGIDFASPAGSPVVAAAPGEVALVSQSLGGLGTIVLVRHHSDYLTVYGRIERVTVKKGDIVAQGQKIGIVTPSPEPRMHFELRRGAESLDPERYFR